MKTTLTTSLDAPLASGSLVALVAYTVAMSVTPGPNTLLVLSSSMKFGLYRSGWHLLGILWGIYLMICLAGVILGGLYAAAPGVQAVLRYAAGFYMLWLAARLWRDGAPPVVQVLRPLRFGEAVLLQLGSPNGWLLAIAMIAGFVPAGGQYLERMLTAALVFCLASIPGLVLWATRGAMLQSGMHNRSSQRLRRCMAAITAATALLFWT
ncbi:MAG: LysE family transporter [Thiobacillus sp.]|nr:LysE family transporter [Thiobacillus sp.]